MGLLDQILSALGLGGGASSTSTPAASSSGGGSAELPDGLTAKMLSGDYTGEEADELYYEDFEEDDTTERPTWMSKRRNAGVSGYGTLHVTDLHGIKNGEARRMFAVYGVPVGWGSNDRTTAEQRETVEAIEAAREEDDDGLEALYSQWGFVDEEHYEWVRERLFPGWDEREALQEQLDAQRAAGKQEMVDRIEGELASELEPIEGVSMETWAGAMAHISQGGDAATVVAQLGIDDATWQRVSEEWNARMSRDTTATIATVYGQAFTGAGAGQFGAAGQAAAGSMLDPSASDVGGEEPIPFERWIEITEAQNAASAQGKDAAEVLAGFGMTPADWGMASGWWSQRFAAEGMKRIEEFNRLSEEFRRKYAGEGGDASF